MAPILKVGTEKRPFLRRGQNRKMGPKSILCQKKKLQNAKRLMFIWENGTFLFSQLFTLMAGTDIRIFAQKSFLFNGTPFFSKDHRRAWTWAPQRRWTRPKIFFCFRFRPFFVIFAKKSYPPPLCGLSVINKPVLTADRLFRPARCAGRLGQKQFGRH